MAARCTFHDGTCTLRLYVKGNENNLQPSIDILYIVLVPLQVGPTNGIDMY